MKYLRIIMFLLLPVSLFGADTDAIWDRANTAYINGNYPEAVRGYDSIAKAGYTGYKLHYNLGNAYFKEGNLGKSILHYNMALRLAPGNPDVKHNLSVANTYIKDKIDKVPEFFLSAWLKSLRRSVSSNAWAWLSITGFALLLSSILLFLLAAKISLRKTGFYAAASMLVIFIVTCSFAVSGKRDYRYSSEAIVMRGAVPVKSSPESNSRDIFIIHEGTKVKMIDALGEWSEIIIDDGNKGWVQSSAIEAIR